MGVARFDSNRITTKGNLSMAMSVDVAAKMKSILEAGATNVGATLEQMDAEFKRRRDLLVDPREITYNVNGGVALEVPDAFPTSLDREAVSLTPFSRRQLFERLGMPDRFADDLLEMGHGDKKTPPQPWAADLLATNLRQLSDNNVNGKRLLLRVVDGTAKGVLSDSFRRMDAAPIFQGFVEEVVKYGMVPYGGALTDTRYAVKFLLPTVYQPIPGEHLLFGASLVTSDYGAGRFEMALFLLRLLCTNGMIGTSLLKQIHLGRELDATTFSQRTYDLDTKTVTSAVRDIVGNGRLLAEGQRIMDSIETDARENANLNVSLVLGGLRRKGTITKNEQTAAEKMYAPGLPVEALPPQPGTWRLSNVLSLLSQSAQNADRALELERASFDVLAKA